MKFFFLEIFGRIKKYSKVLDEKALLENQHWVLLNDTQDDKIVYIFRPSNQLLVSKNGKVKKYLWEFIGNDSLLIDMSEESFLFRSGFIDEILLALRVDGAENYALFVNETKYGEVNGSIEELNNYLMSKYLDTNISEPKQEKPKETNYTENIIPNNVVIVENVCPGCGYVGVKDSDECPDCGLNFR